ncbi:MAG: UDP-N-acetylmuramoyl-tripeptide--D-alanyl-D-alanine ligase, partial [Pleurocapsa sp.]
MNNYFSLSNLSEILDIQSVLNDNSSISNVSVLSITTDSRTVKPGEIFVALVGENFDGHNFVETAIAKGAIAVIVDRRLETIDVPQFVVKDTLEAYQKIAQWWRNQLDIPIIGITGSVGKTSTKELVAAVLSTQGKVLKTQANFNNEIGVPKTLLQITPEHDYAVIEMAMRGEGEIALLTDIVSPTIGIITNVGTAHIGRLGSRKAIARAKCELLAHMPKSSVAILNCDNQLLIDTAQEVWQNKTLTYGMTGGDIKGEVNGNNIKALGHNFPLPLPGEHNASNYLAAIAVAQILNIDLNLLASKIEVELPKGRSRRYNLPNDIVVL